MYTHNYYKFFYTFFQKKLQLHKKNYKKKL